MEYRNDRYTLNALCEFSDKDAESDFLEYEKSTSLIIVRLLILLMGFVFAMFTLSDYYFIREMGNFYISVGLRGTGLFITIVAFSIAGKFKRYDQTLLMTTIVELVIFLIYILNLYQSKNSDISLQFMSMILLILAVFLIPNRWKNCVIAGSIMMSAYIIFSLIFVKSSESPSLALRGIYIFTCLLSCAIFLFGRESSERKHFAAVQLLEFITITDRLTGIYNRGRFEYILGLWIKNMRHDPFCLLLFDIDDFKKVNDTQGHSAGDQVLIGTSEVVTANIRDSDIFARWGGEEFVVLFGTAPIELATELAERLRKAVEIKSYESVGRITISIGVVQYRRGESITDLVNRADEKMYEAKQAGKNRVISEILEAAATAEQQQQN